MKEEKEVIWLIKFYLSDYAKNLFKKNKVACVKDFERLVNAPNNDIRFRKWIKDMININVIEFSERKNNGGFGRTVNYYCVNRNEIIKRLREIDCYDSLVRFFDLRSTLGVSN